MGWFIHLSTLRKCFSRKTGASPLLLLSRCCEADDEVAAAAGVCDDAEPAANGWASNADARSRADVAEAVGTSCRGLRA